MPLQNRVDPFGVIHAVPERGLFTGNRGILHDPATKTLLKRRWTLKAWIICVCEFRGRRREPMGRNGPNHHAGWTELFFLDEVTALAAGHRPCFYCRRERAADFMRRFGTAFGIEQPRVPMLDQKLHRERLACGCKSIPLDARQLAALPDGTMVAVDGAAYALRGGAALHWMFGGYDKRVELATLGEHRLLQVTPPATVEILRTGYRPVWHPSASA